VVFRQAFGILDESTEVCFLTFQNGSAIVDICEYEVPTPRFRLVEVRVYAWGDVADGDFDESKSLAQCVTLTFK
jgi:hypothetical protein